MLVNLYGYKPLSIDTHKRFRHVLPMLLAQYDWKVGYMDLFKEEAKGLTLMNSRNIKCIAVAHLHHDEIKMKEFETSFGKFNERYFSDTEKAKTWIEDLNYKTKDEG